MSQSSDPILVHARNIQCTGCWRPSSRGAVKAHKGNTPTVRRFFLSLFFVTVAVKLQHSTVTAQSQAEEQKPTASSAYVVTLGDGYASGAGLRRENFAYDDPGCRRLHDDVPGGWYAKENGLPHLNQACGARGLMSSESLRDQFIESLADSPYIQNPTESVFFITSGIQSLYNDNVKYNSIPLRNEIAFCHFGPPCALQSDAITFENSIATVASFIVSLVAEIAADQPGTRIRLLENPPLFFPGRKKSSTLQRCWIPGITTAEARFFDQVIYDFNAAVQEQVREQRINETDVDFQIISPGFDRGACTLLPFRHVHRLQRVVGFFPTKRGYKKIYEALKRSLDD